MCTEKIMNLLKELEGNSADIITHSLKNYDGKEHESMIAGVTAMISDIQEMIIIKDNTIKILKRILATERIMSGTILTISSIGLIYISKKQKDLNRIVEKIKIIEKERICFKEDSQVGKQVKESKDTNDEYKKDFVNLRKAKNVKMEGLI